MRSDFCINSDGVNFLRVRVGIGMSFCSSAVLQSDYAAAVIDFNQLKHAAVNIKYNRFRQLTSSARTS